MNSMLRGLPLQTQTVQGYQAAPSALSQIAGLGTAGLGAYGLYNSMNRLGSGGNKGGLTKDIKKRKPAGLAELAIHKMA